MVFTIALGCFLTGWLHAETDSPVAHAAAKASVNRSARQAQTLAQRTLERLAMGDAFDAKLRQRIWVGGREVIGVGHYEQGGGGSGRFSLEMTIHDGDSRQSMRQISDGKLAWVRTQIGSTISIQRVDIGRIDEFERERSPRRPASTMARLADPSTPLASRLPARLAVGGLAELIDQVATDYDLRLGKGNVEETPVWILRGELTQEARQRLIEAAGKPELPPLCPAEVRVAIAAVPSPSGFGIGLPIRFEFWSEPPPRAPDPLGVTLANHPRTESLEPTESRTGDEATATGQATATDATAVSADLPLVADSPEGRLISLLEVYSLRKIEPSPEARFRFESDDRAVTFVNDTRRYLDRLAKPR